MEQGEGSPPILEPRNVRPRQDDVNAPPANDQISYLIGQPPPNIDGAQDRLLLDTSIGTSNQLSALSNSER